MLKAFFYLLVLVAPPISIGIVIICAVYLSKKKRNIKNVFKHLYNNFGGNINSAVINRKNKNGDLKNYIELFIPKYNLRLKNYDTYFLDETIELSKKTEFVKKYNNGYFNIFEYDYELNKVYDERLFQNEKIKPILQKFNYVYKFEIIGNHFIIKINNNKILDENDINKIYNDAQIFYNEIITILNNDDIVLFKYDSTHLEEYVDMNLEENKILYETEKGTVVIKKDKIKIYIITAILSFLITLYYATRTNNIALYMFEAWYLVVYYRIFKSTNTDKNGTFLCILSAILIYIFILFLIPLF